MHPGAWLIWALGAGTVAASTTNPFYLFPLVAVSYLVHSTHRGTGPQARSFRFFLTFAAFAFTTRTLFVALTPGGPTWDGLWFDALEGARLATLLIVFGTFNAVTDPFKVLRLAPRRFHEPALAAALALSLTPRTLESVTQVREAQRLRGMDVARWRSWAGLVIPVLETGMEQAVVLAESMDARGHGRTRRSRYRPERWTTGAMLIAAAAVAAAGPFVIAYLDHSGALSVPTYPIRWPSVSMWLLAGVFCLGMPALVPRHEERR